MERDRAFRRERHHLRLIKALRLARRWGVWLNDPEHIHEWASKMAITPKPCSCFGCGNPRRHFGELTLQEIKANDFWDYDEDEDESMVG